MSAAWRPIRLGATCAMLVLAAGYLGNRRASAAVPIFNGVDLSGWTKIGGDATYHVQNGEIVGLSDPSSANTFLTTNQSYANFVLETEFWIADPAFNSGVQIRSASLPQHNNGRVFGYQVEIDPSTRAWSGGLYFEGGSPLRPAGWLDDLSDNPAAQAAFVLGQWNRFRIVASGRRIQTWINDVPAADFYDDDAEAFLPTGFIGLQVHSNSSPTPLEVRWRSLAVSSLPTLTVNRATGEATLSNAMDVPIELTGYTVASTSGSLDASGGRWLSLAAAGEAGWNTSAAASTELAEETVASAYSLSNGATRSVGRIYAPQAVSFGVDAEDLDLQFSEGGPARTGLVEYVGPNIHNNLVLLVDPDSGEAVLKNTSPFEIALTGYSIASSDGALSPGAWAGLADRGLAGWDRGASLSTALTELNPYGQLALPGGGAYAMGPIFSGAPGTDELALKFLLDGDSQFRPGETWFRAAADFDLDGAVDARDLSWWQSSFGVDAGGDADGDSATTGGDFLVWQRQVGDPTGATQYAVAEPDGASLAGAVALLVALCRRRRAS